MVATTATTTPFDAKDVNDQVNKTINQGGLLMRMAKAQGEKYAAGRGLANSSIGAEASQRSVVQAALPIAQQNAQQANQRHLQTDAQQFTASQNALDRQQQISMLDKTQGWQAGQNALDRQQQISMLDKTQGWQAGQNALDRKQQSDILNQQAGINKDSMAQEVVANTHGKYLTAVQDSINSYNERYAAVMADSNITAANKTTLVNNMKNELNSTLKMYQSMYSNISTIRPDWSSFPTITLPGVSLG